MLKKVDFEKAMLEVENGGGVELLATEYFRSESNPEMIYCFKGRRYLLTMYDKFYVLIEQNPNGTIIDVVVAFNSEKYRDVARADLKAHIEANFSLYSEGKLCVEVFKVVTTKAVVDHVNKSLRSLNKQGNITVLSRIDNGNKGLGRIQIVCEVETILLQQLCDYFAESIRENGKEMATGYSLKIDVDIAEYDFFSQTN